MLPAVALNSEFKLSADLDYGPAVLSLVFAGLHTWFCCCWFWACCCCWFWCCCWSCWFWWCCCCICCTLSCCCTWRCCWMAAFCCCCCCCCCCCWACWNCWNWMDCCCCCCCVCTICCIGIWPGPPTAEGARRWWRTGPRPQIRSSLRSALESHIPPFNQREPSAGSRLVLVQSCFKLESLKKQFYFSGGVTATAESHHSLPECVSNYAALFGTDMDLWNSEQIEPVDSSHVAAGFVYIGIQTWLSSTTGATVTSISEHS